MRPFKRQRLDVQLSSTTVKEVFLLSMIKKEHELLNQCASFLTAKETLQLSMSCKVVCKALNNFPLDLVNYFSSNDSQSTKKIGVDILSMLSHIKFLDSPRFTKWHMKSIRIGSTTISDTDAILDLLTFREEFKFIETLEIIPELINSFSLGVFPKVKTLICLPENNEQEENEYSLEKLALLGRSINFSNIEELIINSRVCINDALTEESPSMLPLFPLVNKLKKFIWNKPLKTCEKKHEHFPWLEEVVIIEECDIIEHFEVYCVSFSVHEKLDLTHLLVLKLNYIAILENIELQGCINLKEILFEKCYDLKKIQLPKENLKLLIINSCSSLKVFPTVENSSLEIIKVNEPENFYDLSNIKGATELKEAVFGNIKTSNMPLFCMKSLDQFSGIKNIQAGSLNLTWVVHCKNLCLLTVNDVSFKISS